MSPTPTAVVTGGNRGVSSRTRVVQVSAALYVAGRVDPERTPRGEDFHPLRTYATTKLCNLLLVPLFARRWNDAGVRINAVHPGVIRTGLGVRDGILGSVVKAVKLLWKSPRAGAAPIVRLALEDTTAELTGRYFSIHRGKPLAPLARDSALAEHVWAQALTCTRLPQTPPPYTPPHVA
jgi:NAD(P)-dependent dehydrogenase (short-subunit alcohol dehydrogenase family)